MANLSSAKRNKIPQKATPGKVVFLASPNSRVSSRTFHPDSSWIKLGVAALIAIVLVASLSASGSSLNYFPDLCEGTWRNSEKAEGATDIPFGTKDTSEFTQENSAVFFGGSQSITCKNFSGRLIPRNATLSEVRILLSLGAKFVLPQEVQTNTNDASTSPIGEVLGEETAAPEFVIVEPSPEIAPEPAATEETPAGEAPAPEEVSPPAPTPVEEAPASVPSPAPAAEEPAPVPAPAPVEPAAWQLPFVSIARAQEQGSDFFATVLYSLDGVSWQALGKVTRDNWSDLWFRIPVGEGGITSIDELSNIQVKIDAEVFTLGESVELYLDGVAVEISVDQYIREQAENADEASLDNVPIGEAMEAGEEPEKLIQNVVKRTIALMREVIPTEEVLPWQPHDYQLKNEEKSKEVKRSVATFDGESGGIVVAGTCLKDYYTVLVFKEPDDYASDPSSALFNSAYPCRGDAYSYELDPSALHLKAGTYYLLVADQPARGPWIPISGLMPFSIE